MPINKLYYYHNVVTVVATRTDDFHCHANFTTATIDDDGEEGGIRSSGREKREMVIHLCD